MILGGFHRIFNVSSSWTQFHEGVVRFRGILQKNHYSDPEIDTLLGRFVEGRVLEVPRPATDNGKPEFNLKLDYRCKETNRLIRCLARLVPPGMKGRFVRTTDKLRSFMPSLKTPYPETLRSRVVYKIKCTVSARLTMSALQTDTLPLGSQSMVKGTNQ